MSSKLCIFYIVRLETQFLRPHSFRLLSGFPVGCNFCIIVNRSLFARVSGTSADLQRYSGLTAGSRVVAAAGH